MEFKDYEVAIAIIKQPLILLDIRDKGAMAAGLVSALGSVADRSISQAWSRYFYDQTEIYQEVHGIVYNNAHNGEKAMPSASFAIALYERSSLIIRSADIQTRLLRDKSIRHLIDACVADNNMNCFEPYS